MYIPYNGAHRLKIFFCVPQILKSFFTASLYFCRFSSVSPSFFSLSIESLYSCTAGCPSSSSLVPSSTSSFTPSGRMRRRVSRTFFGTDCLPTRTPPYPHVSFPAPTPRFSVKQWHDKNSFKRQKWKWLTDQVEDNCKMIGVHSQMFCTKCSGENNAFMIMIAAIFRLYNMTQMKLGKGKSKSTLQYQQSFTPVTVWYCI